MAASDRNGWLDRQFPLHTEEHAVTPGFALDRGRAAALDRPWHEESRCERDAVLVDAALPGADDAAVDDDAGIDQAVDADDLATMDRIECCAAVLVGDEVFVERRQQ